MTHKAENTPEYVASNFLKTGFLSLPYSSYELDVKEIRSSLFNQFKNRGFPRDLFLHEINDPILISKLSKPFQDPLIKKVFYAISEKIGSKSPITLFPNIVIMRNSFPSPFSGHHGWHRDCGAITRHQHLLASLSSPEYIFGKLSIALQTNSSYGGNIDIMQPFYTRTAKSSKLLSLIMRFQELISKSPISNLKLFNRWLIDLFNPLAKKINPKPLQVIGFDTRLWHRGSPLTPKALNHLKKSYSASVYDTTLHMGVNSNLASDKYVLYIHFGNLLGYKTYIQERYIRNDWTQHLNDFQVQTSALRLFSSYPDTALLHRQAVNSVS